MTFDRPRADKQLIFYQAHYSSITDHGSSQTLNSLRLNRDACEHSRVNKPHTHTLTLGVIMIKLHPEHAGQHLGLTVFRENRYRLTYELVFFFKDMI